MNDFLMALGFIMFIVLVLVLIYCISQSIFIALSKIILRKNPDKFIASIDRAEASSDPVVWSKAVRSTLIELGFNEHWVNEEFRERIDNFYAKEL